MNPQTMEYQPTPTSSSYPPLPSRPGPTPLTNAAATAPALYATASGAVGAVGPPSGYQPGANAGYYADSVQQQQQQQQQLPPRIDGKADRTIKSARTTSEFAAREYLSLLRKIGPVGGGSNYSVNDPSAAEAFARARSQQLLVLDELQTLRRGVAVVIREAEAHRWRKWVLGGVLASIIPLVRRVFRRPSSKDGKKKGEDHSTTITTVSASNTSGGSSSDNSNAIMNATEYAFAKSRSLIKRIRESVRGSGWFLGGVATVAFFVLSVLYVFENEVSLRVAKTVSKRLKRLTAKIERGGATASSSNVGGSSRPADALLDEKDLAVLQQGWRWRVLTWSG